MSLNNELPSFTCQGNGLVLIRLIFMWSFKKNYKYIKKPTLILNQK